MSWGYWLLPCGKLVDVPTMAHYRSLIDDLGYKPEGMYATLERAMHNGLIRICWTNDFSVDLLIPVTCAQRDTLQSLAKTYLETEAYWPITVRMQDKYWTCDTLRTFNEALISAADFSRARQELAEILPNRHDSGMLEPNN